ncbi:hypothetical protein VF_A0642 [Aliivibrio fischeri ES114]|uniref:Uncharacterized protein n=1 Tax=Aliivibrio fischeri (strain ATCC 700601 / ES114) TaxID=312309 RepID=Q5DZT4_ALIF1|nr:hypothetical protein [Aliivibrio fischeri]AAW87712.1 hypothetical protein VF_A0642 [Aliivibrio fischeri ES114]KLU78138.1 hypothetical protein AB192_13250 [Aliivibrio fischeri]
MSDIHDHFFNPEVNRYVFSEEQIDAITDNSHIIYREMITSELRKCSHDTLNELAIDIDNASNGVSPLPKNITFESVAEQMCSIHNIPFSELNDITEKYEIASPATRDYFDGKFLFDNGYENI